MAMEAMRIAAKESKIMKFFLGGFIFLAVGGLVFTDINGYFRGGLPNNTVARVGDTEISILDFDNELRGVLQQTGMSAKEAYQVGLVNAYLDNRIDQIAAIKKAEDIDLTIGDAYIAQQISKTFSGASKDDIQNALRARGMSEKQVANSIRQQVMSSIVNAVPQVLKGQSMTASNQAFNRIYTEQRSGMIYSFSAEKLTDDITVTDEEITDTYEATKPQYLIPEERQFIIGKLTLDDVKSSVPAVSEDTLKEEYESNKQDYITPEKRSIAQIVLQDPDQAQQVYEKTLEGTPLKTALKDVTGSEDGYRDTAEYEEDGLPEELSAQAFDKEIKAGDVVAPVKTLVGWHIMKVTNISPEKQKSFAEVKKILQEETQKNMSFDAMYNRIVETEDMLNNGEMFDSIASKTKLKTTTTKSFTNMNTNDLPEDIKKAAEISPSVIEEIFNLDEGHASYPVEIDENSYIVIGVKSIKPQDYKSLSDVKNDIKKAMIAQRRDAAAAEKLASIDAAIKNGEKSLDDIAKEYGATSKSFKDVSRDNKNYDTTFLFGVGLNDVSSQVNNGTVSIAKVNAVNFNGKAKEDQKVPFAPVDSLWRQYLRGEYKITINQELLSTQYGADTL